MSLLDIVNVIYVIAAFSAMLLLAHKKSIGFLIFLITEVCMVYIGYRSHQYGICTMAGAYFVMNIWAYRKWERENVNLRLRNRRPVA